MKTLTEMKKVCCFNRFFLFAVALSLVSTFISCSSDDEEPNIPVYSVKDVEGTYSGKMLTVSIVPTLLQNYGKSNQPVGIDVNAEVKDDQIFIKKFPVDDLIKGIIEDPESAEAIIKAIGDVDYEIPYKAAFDDNKNNILLQLSPEPLTLEIKTEPVQKADGEETPSITVKVSIKADEKGNFAYQGKKLTFKIQTTEVLVNNEPFEFPVTTFSFGMIKN